MTASNQATKNHVITFFGHFETVSNLLTYSNFSISSISTEAYSESSRTSMIELFCENSKRLIAGNYVRKKAPWQIFGWVLNTPQQQNFLISRIFFVFLSFDIFLGCVSSISYSSPGDTQ